MCACLWDEFSEFLLENRVPTLADFNTYPIRIFNSAASKWEAIFILTHFCFVAADENKNIVLISATILFKRLGDS